MEQYPQIQQAPLARPASENKMLKGVFFLIVGVAIFLHQFPATRNITPDWLYGFEGFLILLGIYKSIKDRFQKAGGLILVLVGLYFILANNHVLSHSFLNFYALPTGIIIVGLFYIFKRN